MHDHFRSLPVVELALNEGANQGATTSNGDVLEMSRPLAANHDTVAMASYVGRKYRRPPIQMRRPYTK